MLNGLHAPNRPFTDADRAMLTAVRPQSLLLFYPDHHRADADFARSIGCNEIIIRIDPDKIEIHHETILAAVAEFGDNIVIQLGNEPDPWQKEPTQAGYNLAEMWQHRFYLNEVVAKRSLYPKVKLLSPPLRCYPRNMTANWQWLLCPLVDDKTKLAHTLRTTYGQFDGIAIHIYDYDNVDQMINLVNYYAAMWPTKELWITEYGINDKLGEEGEERPRKVAEYRRFIAEMNTRPYVHMAGMFIAGKDLPGTGHFWDASYVVGNSVAALFDQSKDIDGEAPPPRSQGDPNTPEFKPAPQPPMNSRPPGAPVSLPYVAGK